MIKKIILQTLVSALAFGLIYGIGIFLIDDEHSTEQILLQTVIASVLYGIIMGCWAYYSKLKKKK